MDAIHSVFLAYVTTSDAPSRAGFVAAARSEGFTADFAFLALNVFADAYPNLIAVLA
jgi:hypothetical protein